MDSTSGSISGGLSYPSDFLPAQSIYAITVDGASYFRTETVSGQSQYSILGVRPGNYFVLTTRRWPPIVRNASGARFQTADRFGAAYTRAVICGNRFGCNDHTLVVVHVDAGVSANGVDATDWYSPQAFPLIPGGSQNVTLDAAPSAFDSARAAATSQSVADTYGRLVASLSDCPVNTACVGLAGEQDGHDAAYFAGFAGSNHEIYACAFYVWSDGSGWHGLPSRCARGSAAFPTIGARGHVILGMGEQGCVNVRESPGLTAKVIACLAEGTSVQIDGGPYYLGGSSVIDTDYWWHLSGRGWMVHRYLA